MDENVQALIDQRAKLVHDARELTNRADEEKRDMSAEEVEQFDAMHRDASELKAKIDRREQQAAAEAELAKSTDTRTGRPDTENATQQAGDAEAKRAEVFEKWVRHGMGALDADERQYMEKRDLSTGTSNYALPSGVSSTLEEALLFYGPMLQLGTIINTADANTFAWPTADDTENAGVRMPNEGTAYTSTADPTFNSVSLGGYMYLSKWVKISIQLLRDSVFDVNGFLGRALGERLGRIMNTDCTTGDGTDDPYGVVPAAVAAGDGVTAAGADAITLDEMLDVQHLVDRAYRVNGAYMMNDSTLKSFRKLKDGESRYIWQASTAAGEPDTLFGRPVHINNDMADLGTGETPVLFGDFSKYLIRLVGDTTVVRTDELYIEALEVGFLAFRAMDADLIDAGTHPVEYITCA